MNLSRLFVKIIRLTFILVVSISLLQPTTVRAAGVCYVKWDADGTNTGANWANAYNDLQSAINNADCLEIWVAAGVYKPTSSTNRAISFHLKNNLALYGGFAGSETERDARDWDANITILSGDIGATGDQSDNSFHVLYAYYLDATAALDGFTISGGNANGDSLDANGGGMISYDTNLVLTNLTFIGNAAARNGGGLSVSYGPSTMSNIRFSQNSAMRGGGMSIQDSLHNMDSVLFEDNSAEYGGGIYALGVVELSVVTFSNNSASAFGGGVMFTNGNLALHDSVFSSNSANNYGGGMYVVNGTCTARQVTFTQNSTNTYGGGITNMGNLDLADVTFDGNSAHFKGGGIYNRSTLEIENVTFSHNHADRVGGALANDNYYASATLVHATLHGNTAAEGGGGIYYSSETTTTIHNSILWGNSAGKGGGQIHSEPEYYPEQAGTVNLSNTVVQDGCPEGSICEQVLATDPLLGALDDYGGFSRTIPISFGSSALNAASEAFCPALDQRGVARPQGRGCDMGAFELVYFETFLPLVER